MAIVEFVVVVIGTVHRHGHGGGHRGGEESEGGAREAIVAFDAPAAAKAPSRPLPRRASTPPLVVAGIVVVQEVLVAVGMIELVLGLLVEIFQGEVDLTLEILHPLLRCESLDVDAGRAPR